MTVKTNKKPSFASRIKTDPALLARARRDPGLRSKLPDNLLTPTQRQARRRNQYLADVGDVTTPLQGQSLVNTAQQMVDSEYAPLLASVGQQEQIVNKSAGLQGDWAKRYYGDLNSLVSNIGTAQATANTAATQGAADRGAATKGAIDAADTAARQRMTQDADVRGAGLQGSAPADLAARTAAAQEAATQEAGRAQTSAQQFGDASAAFLRGLQGAAAQQGGEYQGQVTAAQNAALAKLAQDRTDLSSKKAGTFTSALLGLRQNEQQNAITQAGLGIKADSASATADASAGAEGRKFGYTPSEWLQMPASTRTAIVAAAEKSKNKAKANTGYGPGAPGLNKFGYTYDEWTALDASQKAKARAGKGAKGGAGTNDATGAQVGTAQTETSGALSDAETLYAEGVRDRHKLATILMQGRGGGETVSVTQKTKDGSVTRKVPVGPDGQPIKDAPAVVDKHDALWTSIALDVLIDGHVSRPNARRLHAQGLTVEDLGFPSYTDYQKKNTKKSKLSPSERAPGGT